MDYFEAFRFPFRSPKWGMNLLYGSLMMMIPLVGPIVLLGYFGDVLDILRKDRDSAPPDLDFGRFGKNLERGIWPFLASLLATLLIVPLFLVAATPLLAIPAMRLEGTVLLVPIGLTLVLVVVAWVAAILIMTPAHLHAMEARKIEFGAWPGFINEFIRRVGTETLVGTLCLMAGSLPLMIAGYACCIVGVYPAVTIFQYAQWHLMFQLYDLFLERGGQRIVLIGASDDWIS